MALMKKGSVLVAIATVAALSATALTQVGSVEAAHADGGTFTVDLGTSTGSFYGGANGTLYGLAKDGVPNDDVVAPLHMRTIAQKPDGGAQHPSGDALNVAPQFFRTGGKQLFIYMQDLYTQFPYENPGLASYQQSITPIIASVKASQYRSGIVYVPFNEPDNIWYNLHSSDSGYAASRDQFFQDWKTVYTQIRQGDPGAKIAGPNTAEYDSTFMREFLAYAKANNVLPDVMTWHELLDGWTVYRGNYADYRSIEQQLGITAIPINIDEYAQRSDQSVPGKMIQWMAGFEDTKVDAMQAFWGITEDIQGNAVRSNEANASWWLMRWYGSMTGNTVKTSPPSPNTQDTTQGIATLDTAKKQARVILGGGAGTSTLAVNNVPTGTFGTRVHAQVLLDRYSGWESTAATPPTITEGDYTVSNGAVSIPLPQRTGDDALQVILTPSSTVGSTAPASPPTAVRYEAENAAIVNATVYSHNGLLEYPSSGTKNVGSINQSNSRLTYTVNAPVTGQYQLDILYGSQATDLSQQIMKIDSGAWQYVTYAPTLNFSRNGKKTLFLPLTAGSHTITFGVSDPAIGNTNSNITQDAIDLTALTAATTTTKEIAQRYDAEYADLAGAASVATSTTGYAGTGYVASNPASQSSSSNVIVNAKSTGFYDLSARYSTPGTTAAAVQRSVNGQTTANTALPATNGAWAEASQTVWLKAGINQVRFTQSAGAAPFALDRVDVTPVVGDTTSLAPIREAESATLAGATAAYTNSNASGGKYVGNIGNGAANTLTFGSVNVPRTGTYAVNVAYANADRPQSNTYNTELIDRHADVTTSTSTGTAQQRVYFKNTNCWSCYQTRTFYVTLTAGSNSIQFGNSTAFAPDIDSVQVAPVAATTSTIEAEASSNVLAGTASRSAANGASGGSEVGFVGNGAGNTLTVKGVPANATGTANVTIRYASADTRSAQISVNGASPISVTFPSTGSFTSWASLDVQLPLTAGGNNTLTFSNAASYTPDFDKVSVIG